MAFIQSWIIYFYNYEIAPLRRSNSIVIVFASLPRLGPSLPDSIAKKHPKEKKKRIVKADSPSLPKMFIEIEQSTFPGDSFRRRIFWCNEKVVCCSNDEPESHQDTWDFRYSEVFGSRQIALELEIGAANDRFWLWKKKKKEKKFAKCPSPWKLEIMR